MKTWRISLFALVLLLLSCDKEQQIGESILHLNVNAKEVLIDIVDIENHHLAKDRYTDFQIVANNDSIINAYLVESNGNTYLGFKPVLPLESGGADTIKLFSRVYLGRETVTVVESTFRLDSVHSTSSYSSLYYTNTENSVFCRPAETPVRLLVGTEGAYREEGQAKFCVVFNFPSVEIPYIYSVDYSVTISGFMGQNVEPIQRGLMVTDNLDGTQNVALAIEGTMHNYYDAEGTLQEPYNITYELVSRHLFGNSERHILQITNSGDCSANKIQACSFDGQKLNLDSVVAKNSFGGEYIYLSLCR